MIHVAAFQMIARPGDVTANLDMIDKAVSEAKRRGASLLVAPELATTGYGAGEAIRDLAEPHDGPQARALAAMAARHNLSLIVGFAERTPDAIYNSALLADPSGGRCVYRKSHLYGDYERALFAAGDSPPRIVELGALKVGILICYDVEFPEAVRHLALAGAELILVPTALPLGPGAAFIAGSVVPVRAFENGIAVVYANHAGADERFTYAGLSCIALPDGAVAARASPEKTEMIVAEYDPSRFDETRALNPYLRDRRAGLS